MRDNLIAGALALLLALVLAGCAAAGALAERAAPPGTTVSASFYGLAVTYTRGGEVEKLEPTLVTPAGAAVTEIDPDAAYMWVCPGRAALPVSGTEAEAVLDWGWWLAQSPGRPCDSPTPR